MPDAHPADFFIKLKQIKHLSKPFTKHILLVCVSPFFTFLIFSTGLGYIAVLTIFLEQCPFSSQYMIKKKFIYSSRIN